MELRIEEKDEVYYENRKATVIHINSHRKTCVLEDENGYIQPVRVENLEVREDLQVQRERRLKEVIRKENEK